MLVHAVLDAGAPQQTILLELTRSEFGGSLDVSDATVSIATPDGVTLEATAEFYSDPVNASRPHYRVAGLGSTVPIVPGGVYRLNIRTAGGREISGTTTVPRVQPTHVVTDVLFFARARDTLRLSWPRVPGARSYVVTIRNQQRSPSGFVYRWDHTFFTDTAFTLAGTARSFENDEVFIPGADVTVLVSAVDDNYYTYFHPAVDPFAGAPPSRLTGAIGVFGSVVPILALRFRDVR